MNIRIKASKHIIGNCLDVPQIKKIDRVPKFPKADFRFCVINGNFVRNLATHDHRSEWPLPAFHTIGGRQTDCQSFQR